MNANEYIYCESCGAKCQALLDAEGNSGPVNQPSHVASNSAANAKPKESGERHCPICLIPEDKDDSEESEDDWINFGPCKHWYHKDCFTEYIKGRIGDAASLRKRGLDCFHGHGDEGKLNIKTGCGAQFDESRLSEILDNEW